LPLSFAQTRLWLLSQFEPGSAYNIPSLFRLKRNFQLAVFEQALSEIVRRHEILRAYYLTAGGRPLQKIAPVEPFRISVIDLQTLPEAARQNEVERLAFLEATQTFDLNKPPLIRATLLKLAPEEHVLLLNVHHIAFDGWSYGVLVRELSALYNAFLKGRASPLPELPIQYVDFAAWQRQELQGEVLQAQLDYWKGRLGGTLPLLELPSDRPRPVVQTHRGGMVSFALSTRLTDALKSLSRQEDVTLFVTLFATFNMLLLRYTGQEDILVGTPIANRNRPEIEGLIGFFVNMLVLRSDLSGNPTFRELLRRVKETAIDAYEHQDLPFEKLVEELNPQRDVGRSPVFQVIFSYLNAPMQSLELDGLKPSRLEYRAGGAKFDLELYLEESDEGLAGWFSYNADLFEEARIARMVGHYKKLLEEVVSDPEGRLHHFPLLTHHELEQLLVEWNATKSEYPDTACIHELFEIQASRTPEAVAVKYGGQQLTYSELNARSKQFAQKLQALGVGPDVLVAVFLERSLDMVVALLGILKAGGAYLPLDLEFPRERLAFMLGDAQPRVLVTQVKLQASLPPHQSEVIYIDSFSAATEVPTGFQSHDSRDLAYVLYTSGSTGKPKGVAICHRAVVNFLSSMRVLPGIEARDVLLSVTTLSFDICGLELWLPLTTGATVVIAPKEVAMIGQRLADVMASSGTTVMQATPATWRLLLESGWQGNPHLKILCGGEAWSQELAQQLLPKCSTLWNMYGPTETTIWSAVYRVQDEGRVLIGRPIGNTQFYVVDSQLQPVPAGVAGELLIGGDGLARGYLKRRDLTAEKFIANPFNPGADSRLYRTGDLVRYLADGNIEFLARADDQVKIRGFRIELGEIESVLRTCPGVSDAAVVVREQGENQRLVAYVVSSKEGHCNPAQLLDQLKMNLPDYMVPFTYVMIEKLPLTANGKIDRKALPTPGRATIKTQSPPAAPRDMLEQQLKQLWEKILPVHPIGLTDNFFDLGGHSFVAVQLFSEIKALTGIDLPLATIFRAPTVAELAGILRKGGWSPHWSSLVPIQPGGSRYPLFLAHGAEGNVLLYAQLARYLGSDQPVYGFQSQWLNGNGRLHPSISEMASSYIRELTDLQPSGPYFLGGYCLGGIIALEMAQQLQAQGQKVALVAMVDTYNLSLISQTRLRELAVIHSLQNFWFHVANLLLARDKGQRFVREKSDVALTRLGIRVRALCHALYGRSSPRTQNGYLDVRVKKVNEQAAMQYEPKAYCGRVVLIRPKGSFWGLNDPASGWGEVIRDGLLVREIPVYPKGLLVEPFVKMLAEELTVYLRGAHEGAATARRPTQLAAERNPRSPLSLAS
jgi:amino acid adenylation domain-containing protein